MPEIFINYRTIDGKDTAYRLYDELTRRFGEGRAFLAAKSIPSGENYVSALDKGVRRSTVLVALIGPRWLDAPEKGRPGHRALDREGDWVRREIEEAFSCGLVVLPILLGRSMEQLDAGQLPPSIARLAECQYLRFALRTAAHDLKVIGDELARIVPTLAASDRDAATPDEDAGGAPARPGGRPGDFGGHRLDQGSTVTGDNNGVSIGAAHGPLHTGTGDLVSGDRFDGDKISGDKISGDRFDGDKISGDRNHQAIHGDGAFVQGDVHGLQQQFGASRRRKADER